MIHHRKKDLEGFDVEAVIPIGSEIIKTLERADSKRGLAAIEFPHFSGRNVVCERWSGWVCFGVNDGGNGVVCWDSEIVQSG